MNIAKALDILTQERENYYKQHWNLFKEQYWQDRLDAIDKAMEALHEQAKVKGYE